MKSSKKLSILLLAGATVLMSGCSSSSKTSSTTTLYWWRPKSDAREEALKKIVEQYNNVNTSVKIEIVTRDPRTYEEDVAQALAANQSVQNAPDIFSINAEDLPKYGPQLAAAPDNLFNVSKTKSENTGKNSVESVKDLYENVVAKSCILKDASGNDKLFGLPMALDTLALYVNTDLVQKSINNLKSSNKLTNALTNEELTRITKLIQTGPKTWTELATIVPYLTIKDGETITQSAIALGTGSNVERSYDILSSIMLQNGTQLTSSDMNSATFNQSVGKAASNATPGLTALNFYTSFANPQKEVYTWNSSMPNDVEAFEHGQVAMIIHYADLYRYLITEAPSMKSKINVLALPQITDSSSAVSSGQLKTAARMQVEVASSAKGNQSKQKAAWQFIQYVTSKKGAPSYMSHLQLASALKDGQNKSKFTAFTTEKTWADLWYKGHKSSEVDQIFIAMIDKTAANQSSAEDAINEAAKDTSTILQAAKTKWGSSE